MRARSLSDQAVLPALAAIVARDRNTTAEMLDHMAEADSRGLYRPQGYDSMFAYCVAVLYMSDDIALKRIRAARVAQEFPAVLDAVADGRLHLTAVVLLAPHIHPDNADELMAAATHRTKSQIECLLAERFPKPDVPTEVRALSAKSSFAGSIEVPGSEGPIHDQLVPYR